MITLNATDVTFGLTCGFVLCLVYFYLLWKTIQILPQTKHPTLLLFISSALRIFLLIFVALVCAQGNVGRFLLIFCAFVITRIILLKFAKPTLKKKVAQSEIAYRSTTGKASKSAKSTSTQKNRKTKR